MTSSTKRPMDAHRGRPRKALKKVADSLGGGFLSSFYFVLLLFIASEAWLTTTNTTTPSKEWISYHSAACGPESWNTPSLGVIFPGRSFGANITKCATKIA